MYEAFYNLKAEPFRLSPDHKFCYEHKGYAKARAYMAYAFKRAEGFVMITGRPGTGKTTLVGELVESLASDKVRTANLVCTQLQADDLLKTVAFSFGVSSKDYDKAELLQRLTTLFQRWHQEGGRALLIVDEAQDLSVSAMEELRLLTNIQIGGQPLVQIFLLGQPELRDLVMAPEMEQVHQRVIAASHLRGLEVDEAEAYVVHRLHKVGWKGDPAIDRAIFPLIHKFSEGVPRRINLICSRLFLLGSVEQRHKIEVVDVRDVIGELQAENLAAGSWFSEADFDLTREPDWLEVPGAETASEAQGAGSDDTPHEDAEHESTEAEAESEGDLSPGGPSALDTDTDDSASAELKKKAEEEAGGVEPGEALELNSPEIVLEESSEELPEQEQATAEPESAATVDVIAELFEIVTDEEHVDAPQYLDEFEDDPAQGYQEDVGSQEHKYFSGNVIAEPALASEEAVAELSDLPENFVSQREGGASPDDEAPTDDLDSAQRNGKEWPLRTKGSESAVQPRSWAKKAIAALALVALVGAGVFFLELYLSRQDQVVQTQVAPQAGGIRAEAGAASNLGSAGGRSRSERASDGEEVFPESEGLIVELESAPETVPSSVGAEEGVLPATAADEASMPDSERPSLEERVSLEESDMTGGGNDSADVGAQTGASNPAASDEAVGVVSADATLAEGSKNLNPPQPVAKQVFVINFDFDSAALGGDANAVLARALQKLREFPASTATIAKNVSGQTPGASASAMADARASAVQRFFLAEGVDASRISIKNLAGQSLASSLSGQNSQRTVQVTVSRTLEG